MLKNLEQSLDEYCELNDEGKEAFHMAITALELFGNLKKVTKHPTQKPIPLLEYLIKTYTNEGDTVLDNCMGSGSTGVACVNLNRNFIGMDLKQEYFNIATERINDARLNQQAALGGDGDE
jgi:site-specific DNA-methyltransferase (adenine-specific)